jgi:hypothetical protein
LGDIVLSGPLEFVDYCSLPLKTKYYGCFVFETFLIIVRAKRATLYKPKHWLPLRIFHIEDLHRGESKLTSSCMKWRHHTQRCVEQPALFFVQAFCKMRGDFRAANTYSILAHLVKKRNNYG